MNGGGQGAGRRHDERERLVQEDGGLGELAVVEERKCIKKFLVFLSGLYN